MTEQRDSYLLPCSCGQSITIELRQAGETVTCVCGQSRTAPRLGEIRRLPRTAETAKAARPPAQWGDPQRYLLAGLILIFIAVIAAAIIYRQYPTEAAITGWFEHQKAMFQGYKPWDALQYYRRQLVPGVSPAQRGKMAPGRARCWASDLYWPWSPAPWASCWPAWGSPVCGAGDAEQRNELRSTERVHSSLRRSASSLAAERPSSAFPRGAQERDQSFFACTFACSSLTCCRNTSICFCMSLSRFSTFGMAGTVPGIGGIGRLPK